MESGGWQNWVRLAALGLIWGASFTAVGVAIDDYEPLTIAAIRLIIAALILVPIALWRHGVPSDARIWLFALIAAIVSNALPFTLLNWGQKFIASSVAGVFMAALPLIVLPLSHFFVPGQTMSMRKIVGLTLGFVGVLLLIGLDALSQLGGGGYQLLAQLACLAAAICYGFGSIVMKRAPKSDPLVFGAMAMGLAAIIATPIALSVEGMPEFSGWVGLGALLYLGAVPTALAMVILLVILDKAGPLFLSLVNYQVPVWAIVFGAIFLGEEIPARLGVALLMILIGVAISQGLFAAKPAPRPRETGPELQPKTETLQ